MAQQLEHMDLLKRAAERMASMAETDPELAALKPAVEVTQRVRDPCFTYQQILATVFSAYARRPAVGSRAYEIIENPETGDKGRRHLPAYGTITYAKLVRQIEAVANFWKHAPKHRVHPRDIVAFMAFNGAEMTAVDLACVYANAIVVPLQANSPKKDLEEILADTDPVTMIASIDNLALAASYALEHESFRSLIVIDTDGRVDAERREVDSIRAQLAGAGGRIALATFEEVIEEGSQYTFEPLLAAEAGRDDMIMIMYTSGSTGTPKGAMIHEAMLVNTWTMLRSNAPMVSLIYAPMNHFMGRNALYATLAQGGTAYFTLKGDLSTLLDDIQLARPTSLGLIPRICELAQQHYRAEADRRVRNGCDPDIADREVRSEMAKTFFGDRLMSATVGSAPTTPQLRQFMCDCFDIPVSDGYSCTETGGGGITFNNRILPSSVVDFKLIDVPELGYYTSDKPHPRGELLVKTTHMIKGYYKRPEASAAIFDPEGFLKTGDIVERRGADTLVWLDRRNNVVKLAQGEYIAIGQLESTYVGNGKLIRQIYLYGSSQRSFPLAVVVPKIEIALGILGRVPSDVELRQLVLEDMRETARKAGLKSFEVARDVLIEREPFSLENGLLSGVGKPLRSSLKQRYAEALESIYQDMDRRQTEERSLLSRGDANRSTLDRVAGALKLILGLAELDPASPQNYTELGGDSLGAVNMSLLVEEMFAVSLPVSAILHPAASAGRLAAQIDQLLVGCGSCARYDVIHADPNHISASELDLGALLDDQTLSARSAPRPVREVRTVLLTGANGFLGRFLCMEWLEHLSKVDGKLICLVRGQDEQSARKRLEEAIGTSDIELTERFSALAAAHLEVIPADLSAPLLGLNNAAFAKLAAEVDLIVHAAALVNHKLSYRYLFEPNVIGTAELVRLALSSRLKRFDYISSVAVVHMHPELAKASEDADIREKAKLVPIAADHYAMGYAASKWAGEVILREAHEKFGLPINVFRADMILPHTHYRGQINVPDSFTRLLVSLIMAKLAPKSFYRLGPNDERRSTHYDGLPVDFVAGAMQRISASTRDGYHTYNFVNMHYDDGISLDTMVDWIISAGYDIHRMHDHGEWFRRFEEKMRNLPDGKRHYSCLSIVDKFRVPHPVDPMPVSFAGFLAAIRDTTVGPTVPHLSEEYVHKCIRDMQHLGLIEHPAPRPVCADEAQAQVGEANHHDAGTVGMRPAA
jgi:fatty acid CoA ligase FadD9